jgi:fumarate hydratase, class I
MVPTAQIRILDADIIASVRDALQFLACYHPRDFLHAMGDAHAREEDGPARDALAQLLTNSRMAMLGRRPICQDTGLVDCFVRVGMDVRLEGSRSIQELIDEGVRQAYTDPENPLRASMVADPLFSRVNTKDNAPAIVHVDLVPGDTIDVRIMAKGGGGENKARFATLRPADDIEDWVVAQIESMGAGWCPPGVIGIGVGGSAEKAMLLAKEALFDPIDMGELRTSGPRNRQEELRLRLFERLNALGIGAQGLGGRTTVLDVKLREYPAHASAKPVALIPNCAAHRMVAFSLDGRGPAQLDPPRAEDWPDIAWAPDLSARRIDLDRMPEEEVESWRAGDRLLLSGALLTARDAAHKRLADLIARDEPLPQGLDFRGRAVYYVGPVDAIAGEAVGPAGPTTSTRMDPFTDMMLEHLGLRVMVGKAERSPSTVNSIRRQKAAYLTAVGGAGYLISKAIKSSRVVAFADLGMEAVHEFVVEDMPVIVAVDSDGTSLHVEGPRRWRNVSRIPA